MIPEVSPPSLLRLGTRGSALARWQTDYIAALLRGAWPDLVLEQVVFQTHGDRTLDTPLPLIGGKGLFTAELETAIRDGAIDLAVHSLKDLPTEQPAGLVIGAVPVRADARDVVISRSGRRLEQLPPGAVVGTSSRRRAAQLLRTFPSLRIADLRGNVDTRIGKALDPAGPYDAIILAHAGITRLDHGDVVTEILPLELMLPAPGQGALAVQCREVADLLAWLAPLEDAPTHAAVAAERAFLHGLGGGCAVPIAAYAHSDDTGRLHLRVASLRWMACPNRCGPGWPAGRGDRIGLELAQVALAQGADRCLTAVAHDGSGMDRCLASRLWSPRLCIRRRNWPICWPHAARCPCSILVLPSRRPQTRRHWTPHCAGGGGEFDWLVLTSANTVLALAQRLLRSVWQQEIAGVSVAAIGPATAAAALEHLGGRQSWCQRNRWRKGWRRRSRPLAPGHRVLLPQADLARSALVQELAAAGLIVTQVMAYRTIVGAGGVNLPAFFSWSRGRYHLHQRLHGAELLTRLGCCRSAPAVCCLYRLHRPGHSRRAREAGLTVDVVARTQSLEGLVEALEAIGVRKHEHNDDPVSRGADHDCRRAHRLYARGGHA